jgi:beta-lactamase superfamily II metal-dependent hydrolase
MAKTTPPLLDEVEVSLFGPGYGECVVVHLGDGHWMVIDSCLNEAGDQPIALEYLREIGVDPQTQVKLIVITHWHDDHIKGASQLVSSCVEARVAFSAALKRTEFLELFSAANSIEILDNHTGTSEFGSILKTIESRVTGRYAGTPHHWAQEGQILYRQQGNCNCQVIALSPSAHTVTSALSFVIKELPTPDRAIKRFPSIEPNDISVALLLSAGERSVLLGADLEHSANDLRGWTAVLNSEVCPKLPSHTIKVAHHGSANGDNDRIWQEMLVSQPIALITPYSKGSKPLPSPRDVQRIKARAAKVWCTVPPGHKKAEVRDAADKTMKEATRNRYVIRKKPGLVRLRFNAIDANLNPVVETFDGAIAL